ncbi:ABC transporter substrate-binding protein [Desulfobacterales bacterium HSG16]|nr:ABC transporter substrate-binding protein [Desulfobacterales bacterium HSG16]
MKIISALLLLAATFLSGCERQEPQKPVERITVQLKWVHQAQFAGCYIAEKNGFYQSENIDTTLNAGGADISADIIIADLIGGKSHFAIIGGDEFLNAIYMDTPIVAIAVIFQRNPYGYASLKGSKIYRPRDLIGKKIMVPNDGRIQHDALLLKSGIAETDIEQIPYKRDITPLLTGSIDVHMVYRTGLPLAFEEKGVELNFIWMDDYGIQFYADTIVTTEQLVQQNPKLVENFLKATLKGWRYAIEHPTEAVDATLKYDTALSRYRQMQMMNIQISLIHTGKSPIGWMEMAVWKRMQDTLEREYALLNEYKKADIKKACIMKFLKKIYDISE